MTDYNDFIVSLASYSKRIDTLHICLNSLFSQTLKPKKIILYLDDSVPVMDIPKNITAFLEKGLEIVPVKNDLKPHNKYYYSFKRYPNDIIITVDDDVIYDKNLFYHLIHTHKKYPFAVCASRVHYMLFDEDQNVKPYEEWLWEYEELMIPSMRLFATGVGGILYPPNIFPKETLDKDIIKKFALDADDTWLKFMQIKNNIPVVWSGQLPQHPPQIAGTRESGLYITNKKENDTYIQNLINYYHMDLCSLLTSTEE